MCFGVTQATPTGGGTHATWPKNFVVLYMVAGYSGMLKRGVIF